MAKGDRKKKPEADANFELIEYGGAGAYPMLRIRAEAQKNHQDQLLPISREFGGFLLITPVAERTGFVFNPQPRSKSKGRPSEWWVSRVVCKIGEKAGIVVDRKPTADPDKPEVKFASAHDLRRSFGQRLASRPDVTPFDLRELMRHANVETSMKYYVGSTAQNTAKKLWAGVGYNSGYTATKTEMANELQSSQLIGQ